MTRQNRRPHIPRQFRNRDTYALNIIDAAQRRAVIARHARLMSNGKPVLCQPSWAERYGDVGRKEHEGTDRKVIFDGEAAALACARELEALGARPMRVYPCRRSTHGHYHLATDEARLPGRGK